MKYSEYYKEILSCNDEDSVFNKIISSLTNSILVWDYFVNWKKVFSNIKDVEINLNTLNYLVGKVNARSELFALIKSNPDIVKVFPILLACRDNKFMINEKDQQGRLIKTLYNFNQIPKNDSDINMAVDFIDKTGLLKYIQEKNIKSIPDYVIGVEVGIDTNARKNRCGTTMENLVGEMLATLCKKHNYHLERQVNKSMIKSMCNVSLDSVKSRKKFDFAIKTNTKFHIIEVNYYSDGGSKLKSTAGEYITYYNILQKYNINFIWITDGKGWESTHIPLRDTFDSTDYILNLEFLKLGILERILKQEI